MPDTAKPWAYWWWHGSAVDEKNIAYNLEAYAKAGFGGLHIIPIFGIKGEESRFVPFLSPRWVSLLEYTVKEGRRRGLGIDMTLGTGWPYGGSQVRDADAAQAFRVVKGQTPEGRDTFALAVFPTKQKVKRAAPGAEGWVLDHFNAAAVQRYFEPFDRVFRQKNIGIRAFYNDSYEVYGANWTPDLLEQFKKRRGYDLSAHLDVLARDTATTEREKRVWADYHETLSDLLLEAFTQPLNDFTHKYHKALRNEAHGAPANLLDLYGASDIPESEYFGNKPYAIPYHRTDPDYDPNYFGIPGAAVLRLAASAAHVTGKKLVTSETATWLGNHFKVSLQQIKPIIDESFVSGINHIFYHGVTYSPHEAPFPGRLFYASTNFNQQSHFWAQLPLLNGYVERCQRILQQTAPDNDVLLYFPLPDKWHSVGKKDKTHVLDVHTILRDGFLNPSFGGIVTELQAKGYAFDYVSDRQLQQMGQTRRTGTYKMVVVPPLTYLPEATLEALRQLEQAGIAVAFIERLPTSVSGYFEYEKRQARFAETLKTWTSSGSHLFGRLSDALEGRHIRRETMRERGLHFIRKKDGQRQVYFVCNFDTLFNSGIIQLAAESQSVRIHHPLSQKTYLAQPIPKNDHAIEFPLALAPGESAFIWVENREYRAKIGRQPSLQHREALPLKGRWDVRFLAGAPYLPAAYSTDTLQSWIQTNDTAAHYFSGKALYTLRFSLPASMAARSGVLDLGDVRESAEVRLNGRSLGVAWCLPMRLSVPARLLLRENLLEIEVTNLSANRIRYIDRRREPWKNFYDINVVDIRYRPFDASDWPLTPSGLLGPVRFIPYE